MGTFAVPEFGGIAAIILALSIVGIIIATARYATRNNRFSSFRGRL
ncbi:PEFG-CTERM sorting domain-containing protein [Candidatus Nitrososphaera gargensis]|nr:PEFG-CTERM sorting domain-containing protein [Candidatus Nitrososphaera gargensis]